jgi:hypothetical protein
MAHFEAINPRGNVPFRSNGHGESPYALKRRAKKSKGGRGFSSAAASLGQEPGPSSGDSLAFKMREIIF